MNAWIFADLVKTYKNARFMDLGVRLGASSAIMSINADDNNNQVCGCDLKFEGFERTVLVLFNQTTCATWQIV